MWEVDMIRCTCAILLVMSGFLSPEAQTPSKKGDSPSTSPEYSVGDGSDFIFFDWSLRRVGKLRRAEARFADLRDSRVSGWETRQRNQDDCLLRRLRN